MSTSRASTNTREDYGLGTRSDPSDLALFEGLDQVALLEVLEVGQADAALEALTDLPSIFLEPLERVDAALPDDDALAQEADLRAAGDDTRAHAATGDEADARDAEDLAHLGLARDDLFELRCEHADHGALDVLEELVDDLVGADVHALGIGELA